MNFNFKYWSKSQKGYFIFYSIFFLISVWASGESFSRSFEQPTVFSYIMAFVILLLASFCLELVKESIKRGKIIERAKFLSGFIGFIISWFLILSANTHNFYYISSIDEQRQRDLKDVKEQLGLLGEKGQTILLNAKTKFSNNIESEITNLKSELENENNKGHGEETDKIVRRIEDVLGSEIDLPSNPKKLGLRKYSSDMATKIRVIREQKLKQVDEKIQKIKAVAESEQYKTLITELDVMTSEIRNKNEDEINKLLRKSFSFYSKEKETIEQVVLQITSDLKPKNQDNGNENKENTNSATSKIELNNKIKESENLTGLKNLGTTPPSIEFRKISSVWRYFFLGKVIDDSSFYWALFLGLILDLSCFLLWYFGVLKTSN